MPTTMKLGEPVTLTSSMEDYLEAILDLEGVHRVARPKDVAQKLGVHKTTVTAAMRALAARGMVNHAPYGVVTLTDDGRKVAVDVAHRHRAVREFLVIVLGIDDATADRAACRMEHALPREIVDRLLLLTESMRTCPMAEDSGQRFYRRSQKSRPPPKTDTYSDVMHFFNP